MQPTTKLYATLLIDAKENWGVAIKKDILSLTEEEISDLYQELEEDGLVQDPASEFRSGEVNTDIPCDWSRTYESKSVAAKMFDGSWVGWTYWYGGGKYGNSEEIDWTSDAYDLDCKEEEKLVVVRTFSKK